MPGHYVLHTWCQLLSGVWTATWLGAPNAFFRSILSSSLTIDGQYLDGASITYGSNPRKHIWSFACGVNTVGIRFRACPCNNGSTVQLPSFIGNDYYCESVNTSISDGILYSSDPLWDGKQCSGREAPCCTNPNLPWFNKTLGAITNEDIELRLCQDENITAEGVPLQVIELYIR